MMAFDLLQKQGDAIDRAVHYYIHLGIKTDQVE